MDRTTRGLAAFAALQAAFTATHPIGDQLLQRSADAAAKGLPGPEGQRACVNHVTSYTGAQLASAVAVTSLLSGKVPWKPLLIGAAITAATHYAIDRRVGFKKVLRSTWLNKGSYLDHCTAQRREGVVDEAGPGTALMELDQAAHAAFGLGTNLLVAFMIMKQAKS